MDEPVVPEQFQTSNRVLMIRPSRFGFHAQAAQSNAFMIRDGSNADDTASRAVHEFDGLVDALRSAGIEVCVYQDTDDLPDCVFPNNWFSWHTPVEGNPVVVTYPMCNELRRAERRGEVLDRLIHGVESVNHIDLSMLEDDAEILEGTGSLVLDRIQGKAFACLSPRTTLTALDAWCDETGYQPVVFHAVDEESQPIYHTNVMLSVGERVAVVCAESVPDLDERAELMYALESGDRQILEISLDQMNSLCGNILELSDQAGNTVFAMSSRAFNAFTADQRAVLSANGRIVHAPIPTIEDVGGGSVRCMIAEAGRVAQT
ncbi:MAG: hypothetical protein JJ974_04885 [Phycisphaerales bacterium]|nr:hypothetical protein [Phycisphaerales bacterium]